MPLPNFLIIGAGKSGTTALYHYLNQHPQVYMSPIKEPRFFVLEGDKLSFQGPGVQAWLKGAVTDYDSYQSLFLEVKDERAIGEASNRYLWDSRAAPNIKKYIPNAKLIAILRDPVERAYSQYLMLIRLGMEPFVDFERALQHEKSGARKNWVWSPYIEHGLYHKHLLRYLKLFGREQFKIYIYDDFLKDNLGIIRDIFSFLNVDPSFVPNVTEKHNRAPDLVPRNQFIYNIFGWLNWYGYMRRIILKNKFGEPIDRLIQDKFYIKPKLSERLRSELVQTYRADILQLQDLLRRDLSHWLE